MKFQISIFLCGLFVLSEFDIICGQFFSGYTGLIDTFSARRFQEINGLPEDPNSVYPAQELSPTANFNARPSNRIATPIAEETGELPPPSGPQGGRGLPAVAGLNAPFYNVPTNAPIRNFDSVSQILFA